MAVAVSGVVSMSFETCVIPATTLSSQASLITQCITLSSIVLVCLVMLDAIRRINKLKGKPEITRFKGLGEISPDEFVHFIGNDIRLDPVMLDKEMSIEKMLEFYMGKNTPDRQKFIIRNLKVELDIVDQA